MFPADAAERAEALRIQQWFDDDLTPRIRRSVLDALLRQPTAFAGVFGDGRPALQRLAYACAVPLAAPLIRKGNGIDGPASVADGHRAAEQALDFVAQRAGADGYLAGQAFSLADLTAGFDAGRAGPAAGLADGRPAGLRRGLRRAAAALCRPSGHRLDAAALCAASWRKPGFRWAE